MGSAEKDNGNILWGLKLLAYVALSLAAFTATWHAASWASGKPYLPGPASVALKIYAEAFQGNLIENTVITLKRVLTALAIATVLGFSTGLAAGKTSLGSRGLRPFILATYPIPHATLIPILLWILGVEWSKIGVIAMIIYYPIAVSTMEWSMRTPRDYEDLIDSMGGTLTHKILYVTIPYIIPGFLTGLRMAVSVAYAIVFLAESFVLTGGLGAYIEESWHRLDYEGVYSGVVTLSTLGVMSYTILWLLEKAYRSRFM
ncbi:MAG: ABC transporter permease subunit [Thermoprotei archaeon]|nr:ABC transporter permease subunit [Thermoprotei archaeon]